MIFVNLFNLVTDKFYIKILYLIVGLSFATVIADLPYFGLFNTAVLGYALLLSVLNVLNIFTKKREKFFAFKIFLYLFLALTLFLNYKYYNLPNNFKVWLVNFMITTVLFSIDSYKNKTTLQKELNIISYVYVFYSFIASILSLALIYFKDSISNFLNIESFFKNENSFGIATGIGILISLYLIYSSHSRMSRIFNLINIIVQSFALIVSGGRSGYLLLFSILSCYLLFKIKKVYQRVLLVVVPIVCSIVAFFTLPPDLLHKILTSREYIWQSAINLLKKYPLTGVGNVSKIGRMQDSRVAYLQGFEEGGLHNIFFEVAVVNGLISITLFILFIVFLLVFLFKKIDKISIPRGPEYFFIFSLVVGLILVNLLESSLLYIISFISIVFWIYSGYLVAILSKSKKY